MSQLDSIIYFPLLVWFAILFVIIYSLLVLALNNPIFNGQFSHKLLLNWQTKIGYNSLIKSLKEVL